MRNYIDELKAFSDTLGFDPTDVQQGSNEWLIMRSGVITASKADCLLAKPGTAKRDGYMAELVAQICTGQQEEINSKHMQWGKDNEEFARDAYSAATFEVIDEVPFIYKDAKMRAGCSPDGLCDGYGLELKCPWSSRVFIEFACADKIKPEYEKQCQFSMWVTGLDKWVFCNFDPRNRAKKLHYVTIERNEKVMKIIDDAYNGFVSYMDEMLDKLGIKFGVQWSK